MSVPRECFQAHEFLTGGVQMENICLKRLPNGTWSVSCTLDVNVVLADGRRIQSTRHITLANMRQEGRKPQRYAPFGATKQAGESPAERRTDR